MRLIDSPEMKRLKEIFEPYRNEDWSLADNAPDEAVEAFDRYNKLDEEAEKEYKKIIYSFE